jgi:hypothetical protein
MFTRTLGAVVLWLGGAGLALAQMLPLALPSPQSPTLHLDDPMAVQTPTSMDTAATALPPAECAVEAARLAAVLRRRRRDRARPSTGRFRRTCRRKCRARPFRVWASGEYLAWWHKDAPCRPRW